jgi:DNA-binding response OmpR family regulator
MGELPVILIVEDDDQIRLSFRDYLKKEGFEVLVASDGVGAIKQLLDNSIDLIISDYRMELLGGNYWIKFLQRFCPDMKIIFTSGYIKPSDDIPYHVITKPYKYSELLQEIKQILNE